jgi:hypothetical protein
VKTKNLPANSDFKLFSGFLRSFSTDLIEVDYSIDYLNNVSAMR